MKPIQDRIKELLNYKKEKQTEVLSFMEKNDLDVCNTNSGTIELKQSTHMKAIKKADVYDRLVKFFSYDSDKIHGMSSEEKAKFLHNYIYVEDREKSENKSLKCKM